MAFKAFQFIFFSMFLYSQAFSLGNQDSLTSQESHLSSVSDSEQCGQTFDPDAISDQKLTDEQRKMLEDILTRYEFYLKTVARNMEAVRYGIPYEEALQYLYFTMAKAATNLIVGDMDNIITWIGVVKRYANFDLRKRARRLRREVSSSFDLGEGGEPQDAATYQMSVDDRTWLDSTELRKTEQLWDISEALLKINVTDRDRDLFCIMYSFDDLLKPDQLLAWNKHLISVATSEKPRIHHIGSFFGMSANYVSTTLAMIKKKLREHFDYLSKAERGSSME